VNSRESGGRRKGDRRKTEAEKSADQSDRSGFGVATKLEKTGGAKKKTKARAKHAHHQKKGGVICSHCPAAVSRKEQRADFDGSQSRGCNI